MTELRDRMAELNGKVPVQYRLYLPAPGIGEDELNKVGPSRLQPR